MTRMWWTPTPTGWTRTDGFRIDTPNPEAMQGGPWFGRAYPPKSKEPLPEFIRGLDADAAMDKIDNDFPLVTA